MKRDWRMFLRVARVWRPATDLWARTTRIPLLGKGLGYILNEKHYDVTFIPINRDLETSENTVVPTQIVAEMIRRSCHRVILRKCMCRLGCRCHHYPTDIGCVFMGESARGIDPSLGSAVSVEEALEHLERAVDAGLIPQIGRVDPDPLMLGVKPRDRFLTLCFCCSCCCIAMRNMPRWSRGIKDRMHRLEGLSVEVGGECSGCGECADACFAGAIAVVDGKAMIGDGCKGCGLCAEVCPSRAIEIKVTDGELMLAEAFRRIESYADIT